MLKGKCLLLQTVLIFPSAKRALTPSPPQEFSLGIACCTPSHLTQLNDYSQVFISWLYIMEHLTFMQRLVTEISFRNNLKVSFLITYLKLLAV